MMKKSEVMSEVEANLLAFLNDSPLFGSPPNFFEYVQ
jgi:hypothetical protein